jgi:hypothetical protein
MQKKPIPTMLTLLWVAFAFHVISLLSFVSAATCDCRPEFNTEAEGNGWCSRTKENAQWCKLKFNEESATGTDQPQFIAAVKQLGVTVNVVAASKTLNSVPPSDWKPEFIDTHMLTLFSIALWNVAPERLKEIANIMRNNRDQLLKLVTGTGGAIDREGYLIDGIRGCLQFRRQTFATMVRTVFAPSGRFSLLENPDNSPFSVCTRAR